MPVRINGATSGYVELAAPAAAGSTSLTLPLSNFGKLLQIVRASDTSQRSTSSTTYADITGMTVTITPKESTSAILIIATGSFDVRNATNTTMTAVVQMTDSANTAVSGAEAVGLGTVNLSRTNTGVYQTSLFLMGYATPGSTAAKTYKLRWKVEDSNAAALLYNQITTGQMFAIEIAA